MCRSLPKGARFSIENRHYKSGAVKCKTFPQMFYTLNCEQHGKSICDINVQWKFEFFKDCSNFETQYAWYTTVDQNMVQNHDTCAIIKDWL